MKTKILNKINLLLTTLVSMLGFSCCLTSCNEYGVPYANFVLEGRVINEEKEPLENMQVVTKSYWVNDIFYTPADGKFLRTYNGIMDKEFMISVTDTSGVYQSVTVNIQANYTGGKDWYMGSDRANIEFVLKKNEE